MLSRFFGPGQGKPATPSHAYLTKGFWIGKITDLRRVSWLLWLGSSVRMLVVNVEVPLWGMATQKSYECAALLPYRIAVSTKKNGNVLMVSLCVSDDEQCHAGMSCCDDRVTSHIAMSCVCLKYLRHRPMCWFPLASLYKWIRLLKYPNVYSHTRCSFSVSIISKYWQDVRLFSFWF